LLYTFANFLAFPDIYLHHVLHLLIYQLVYHLLY
jgi:hypothetical protein